MQKEKNWENLNKLIKLYNFGIESIIENPKMLIPLFLFLILLFIFFLFSEFTFQLWGHYLKPLYFTWFSIPIELRLIHLASFPTNLFIIFFGLRRWKKESWYEEIFNTVGLKNKNGCVPKIIKEEVLDSKVKKITIALSGHSIDELEKVRPNLETFLKTNIENIEQTQKPGICIMYLNSGSIPLKLLFSEVKTSLSDQYEFIVGQSLQGTIKTNLRKLPHLLIAGATGYGKSQFFKQVITGLMLSSKKIEFYLIDLKRGVEMNSFKELPNFRVLTEVKEASETLSLINSEMDKRFDYLGKTGHPLIDPHRDKKPIICLCIDEASLLFSNVQKNSKDYQAVQKSRHYIERIAKLSRAAGIHIIAATQKIDLHSIPTQVQENFNARVSFRMNTIEGSGRIIRGSGASKLPAIPGRGIWQFGTQTSQFQSPLLTDEEFKIIKQEMINQNKEVEKTDRENIHSDNSSDIIPV